MIGDVQRNEGPRSVQARSLSDFRFGKQWLERATAPTPDISRVRKGRKYESRSVKCSWRIFALVVLHLSAPAAPLHFSVPGGVYTNELTVELSTRPSSAVIRFTLDGTEPTTNSTAYAAPLTVTNSTLIRARIFEVGVPPGPVLAQTYTLLDPDLFDYSSNLPLVIINTFGKGLSHETKVPVSVRFIDRGAGGRAVLTAVPDFDGRALVNIRGHSSLQFPKHSYTLRTRDEAGDGLKTAILGFPKDSDWVLYAPYPDKTLMRDVLAYELSNKIGQYAPRTRFVEVFISRSGHRLNRRHYAGVYVFEEKIKRGAGRVNIEKLGPSDRTEPAISGGYIFKKDHEESQAGAGFTTSRGIRFFYVEPKENRLTEEQKSWLTGYLNQFERILYGPTFEDPIHGYSAYIDSDSFIDLHWIIELSKNIDGYRLSNYLHKDRNGRLKMGPIWDWNLSFGNANYMDGWTPDGWYWPQVRDRDYPWFRRLFKDPDFKQKYVDRWWQLRTNQFAVSNVLARVDELAFQLEEAQARNFKRWHIMGQPVWPNWYVGNSFAEEVNWLKQWIDRRIAWIDSQFPPPPSVSLQIGSATGERIVTLQTLRGNIYYTLDGIDPRARGGAISQMARVYQAAVTVNEDSKLFARSHSTDGWSAPIVYVRSQ